MSNVTIILAGGMSTRFGESKPFLDLAGEPLLSHVIKRASLFSDEIVIAIATNDSTQKYERFLSNRVRLSRDNSLRKSPLVGIVTGLRSVGSTYAMVLASDLPFLNEHVASLLFEKASKSDAAIPRWLNGNIEPLHAVYKVQEARIAAEEAVLRGELKVSSMIGRLKNVVYVSVEEIRALDQDLLTFFNINTREDLKKAEEILRLTQ